MIILSDFHNTISQEPAYFKRLSQTDDFYVITGSKPYSHVTDKIIPSYLQFMNVKRIFARKTEKDCNNFFEAKEWKIKTVLKFMPDVYYDDDYDICTRIKLVNPKIMVVHMVARFEPICWHQFKRSYCTVCKKYYPWAINGSLQMEMSEL